MRSTVMQNLSGPPTQNHSGVDTWYTPTTEGYFNRIRRAQILTAIDEAKGGHGPAIDKLKKSELATRAATLLAGTGWLPEPLRIGLASTPAGEAPLAEAAE